jgi:hypothetical protein
MMASYDVAAELYPSRHRWAPHGSNEVLRQYLEAQGEDSSSRQRKTLRRRPARLRRMAETCEELPGLTGPVSLPTAT